MIIKSIVLKNYRLYKGENRIDFEVEVGKNLFLISGENGFGKTTFLHSLLWCLYGKLITDVESNVRKDVSVNGYNSFLRNNLNKEVSLEFDTIDNQQKSYIKKYGYDYKTEYIKSLSQYSVSIDFGDVVIPSLPCTSIRVVRTYDVLMGKEEVEILIDGVRNELTNEIGPDVFINDFVLNKDIARFFFFDSEEIVSLSETNTAAERKRLCSAYNEVLGVRKYEDLKRGLENVRLRLRRRSADIDGRNRLIGLIERREGLNAELEENRRMRVEIEENINGLREKNEEMQLKLAREGNNATIEEIRKTEAVVDTCKKRDEEYKRELRVFMEYAPFAISGGLLGDAKRQLEADYKIQTESKSKADRNMIVDSISYELGAMLREEVMEEDVFVRLQRNIQGILECYRDSTESGEVVIGMSDGDYEEFMAVYNNITTTYKAEFEHLADNYKKNKQTLERNARKLSNINYKERDEIIRVIRGEKVEIENEIVRCEEKLRATDEGYGMITRELSTVSKQVSELSKRVSLDDEDAMKDAVAEEIIRELDVFLVSLKQEKKYSLERRIKTILNGLMHKEDFIGDVEVVIDGEFMDINLYSAGHRLISKDLLSKGEQQLYATSILKALVDESDIHFPVFIDSPLQKFDKEHAIKIITEFYPQVSKQVVLFPLLHKELSEREYEVMKPYVNSTYMIKNSGGHSFFENVAVDEFLN